MDIVNFQEYFNKKKSYLDALLNVSEELVSRLNDLDAFFEILNQRDALIQEIAAFESRFKQLFNGSLTQFQTNSLNGLVGLILGLDAQINEGAIKEKNNILSMIKTNVNEQKLVQYNSVLNNQDTGLLDYK